MRFAKGERNYFFRSYFKNFHVSTWLEYEYSFGTPKKRFHEQPTLKLDGWRYGNSMITSNCPLPQSMNNILTYICTNKKYCIGICLNPKSKGVWIIEWRICFGKNSTASMIQSFAIYLCRWMKRGYTRWSCLPSVEIVQIAEYRGNGKSLLHKNLMVNGSTVAYLHTYKHVLGILYIPTALILKTYLV